MTKARDLADYTGLQADLAGLQTNITAGDTAARAGRKNLILNGSMQVSQRGTSQSASGYGSLDRWYINSANTVTVTQTATTAAETATLGGLEYYSRLVGTSTDSGRQWFQKIEGLKKFSNETVTFSFYAKAAASTTVNVQYGLLGAGSDTYSVFSTKEIGTSWARYTATVTLPSMSSGFTFASGDNLRIAFEPLETNYTLDITGVQLELGSGTDFEHRSYGEELQLCQRYYQDLDFVNLPLIRGNTSGAGASQTNISFLVETRIVPSITTITSSDGSGGTLTATEATKNSTRLYGSVNITAGHVRQGEIHCSLDAEL